MTFNSQNQQMLKGYERWHRQNNSREGLEATIRHHAEITIPQAEFTLAYEQAELEILQRILSEIAEPQNTH